VLMKRCGHTPMLERPDEFARHLLAFLAAGVDVQQVRGEEAYRGAEEQASSSTRATSAC
jgi:hypothetical protein